MSSLPRDSKPSRILIVDDHPMVRDGLKLHIEPHDEFTVCGEAAEPPEALSLLETAKPDLVIVDLSLKNGHGLDLIKAIRARNRDTKILVLSTYEESLFAERSLRAGALGYVNKQQAQSKVLEAIRTVLDGKRYVSSELAERLVNQALAGKDFANADPVETLTDRETQVFQMMGEGKTTRAIAEQLHLSVHTIDSHREKIRAKLGFRDGKELTCQAVRWVVERQRSSSGCAPMGSSRDSGPEPENRGRDF